MLGLTLVYDAANRLTAYGANQLTFGYRPDGLRAWKQSGSNRTYYFYDGTRLLYEMTLQTNADASATDWQIAQYYGWGVNGLRQAWTPQDGEIDYAFDPQGNVCSRYTDTRRRTEGGSGWGVARVYDAYGQLRFGDRGEAQSDAVGYNGQWGYYTDIASLAASGNGLGSEAAQAGLVLCTYRYYSPDLARWLTRDPLGYDGGINVYAYCEDNPIGGIDPVMMHWVQIAYHVGCFFSPYKLRF